MQIVKSISKRNHRRITRNLSVLRFYGVAIGVWMLRRVLARPMYFKKIRISVERPPENSAMSLTSVSPGGPKGSSNEDAMHAMLDKHAESLGKDNNEVKKRSVMDELLVHEGHHHAHHKYVLRKSSDQCFLNYSMCAEKSSGCVRLHRASLCEARTDLRSDTRLINCFFLSPFAPFSLYSPKNAWRSGTIHQIFTLSSPTSQLLPRTPPPAAAHEQNVLHARRPLWRSPVLGHYNDFTGPLSVLANSI